MPVKNLVLFGTGGLARETIPIINTINAAEPTYHLPGFCVEEKYCTPKRRIGSRATIAAGSVVFTRVKQGTTVLGNPAKRMPDLELN